MSSLHDLVNPLLNFLAIPSITRRELQTKRKVLYVMLYSWKHNHLDSNALAPLLSLLSKSEGSLIHLTLEESAKILPPFASLYHAVSKPTDALWEKGFLASMIINFPSMTQKGNKTFMSAFIFLFVSAFPACIVPRVEIVDERGLKTSDKFYKSGSTIELKCVISKVPQPTSYVTWKHGLRMLNYDTSRGGIR